MDDGTMRIQKDNAGSTLSERGSTRIGDAVETTASLVKRTKRAAQDWIGSALTRDWETIPRDTITSVDPGTLPEVLDIYHSSFDSTSKKNLFERYSALFPHMFYVAKLEDRVVGYCVNYVRLSLSRDGIRKIAVIYSMAVAGPHRHHGIGGHLLAAGIQEMRMNRVDEIRLFTDTMNGTAIALYHQFGFVVVRETVNVCGRGRQCYEMKLAL